MRIVDAREALGINDRLQLAEVDCLLRDRKLREIMLAGVTVEKPETVTIDAGVEIGIDTVIEPFAQILGRTKIGENCRIGTAAIVSNSELADDVEIGPFTVVNTSRLERGVQAGPFARLRMENHVEAGAHVGNFVELKKTYDGVRKHLTTIGEGAFVGSNSTLVAPIEVGDGAYVGAGSVITKPVPPDALAVGRAHQVVKEGWAKKRRERK